MAENRTEALHPRTFLILLKDSLIAWNDDKALRLGAAIAYFSIFSLAPLLLVVIAIASVLFGEDAVRGQIFGEIRGLIGDQGALAIQGMLGDAHESDSSVAATIIGIVLTLLGAVGVFLQLRDAIHTIWYIAEKPTGTIKGFLKTRVVGFTLLLGIGFLLLVSLVVSTVLTALSRYLGGFVSEMEAVVKIIDFFVSLFFITLLFALIFRILPDARMKWKDLWVGSAFIALLFTLGKMAIGLYLGSSKVASTFGAASSLVIVLLWVFYSAQIFLFGAEFTKIFANRFGAQILPDEDAMRVKIEKVEVPTKGGHGE